MTAICESAPHDWDPIRLGRRRWWRRADHRPVVCRHCYYPPTCHPTEAWAPARPLRASWEDDQ